MSSPKPPGDIAGDAAALEQLLTHHIGPMAKIVIGRARKTAADQEQFLASLAGNIVDREERKAFLTAASRLSGFWNPPEFPRDAATSRGVPAEGSAPGAGASSVYTSAGSQGPVRVTPPAPLTASPAPQGPHTPVLSMPPSSSPPPVDPHAPTLLMPRTVGPAPQQPDAPMTSIPRTVNPAPEQPATGTRSVGRTGSGEPSGGAMKGGSIFVSYARENLGAAQRIVAALREAGLEVWLDLGKLQCGDSWDLKIRRNIEGCTFFVALISRETDARPEGYFRREWNLAADRALNFADEVTFILPVTIDDTPAYSARVPERFRRAHWLNLPNGEVTSELVDSLKELVDDYARRSSPT